MARAAPAVALGLVLLATSLSGCISFSASQIPDAMLHGNTGNGWTLDRDRSQDEPDSRNLGLVKTQSLVYRDQGDQGGYPATLTLISLKVAFSTPDEADTRDKVRTLVEQKSDELGVQLQKPPREGQRTTTSDDQALYFRYDGTVQDSDLFDREADVNVVGVVWNCHSGDGNTIVAVALAQVNERTQGVIDEPDARNWNELWKDGDPTDGDRDGGLIVHATCP